MIRSRKTDHESVHACLERKTGAWSEFVRNTAPLSGYLIGRVLARRGISLGDPDREAILDRLYSSLVAEDLKLLRAFPPGLDLFTWLSILSRVACREHLVSRRHYVPLGSVSAAQEPDPAALAGVLGTLPGKDRRRLALLYEAEERSDEDLGTVRREARRRVAVLFSPSKAGPPCVSSEKLSGFLDGETDERMSVHLDACSRCAQELERLAAADRLLRDVLFPIPERTTPADRELVRRLRILLPSVPTPNTKPRKKRWGLFSFLP